MCSQLSNDHQTTSEDLVTSPHDTFYSRSLPTVLNWCSKQSGTPRPSSPTSQDLTRPYTALSRPPTDFTRALPTSNIGRGRPPSRLSVTGALTCVDARRRSVCERSLTHNCFSFHYRDTDQNRLLGYRRMHRYVSSIPVYPGLIFLSSGWQTIADIMFLSEHAVIVCRSVTLHHVLLKYHTSFLWAVIPLFTALHRSKMFTLNVNWSIFN